MKTLTVAECREMLQTGEGRLRLDAATARACGWGHVSKAGAPGRWAYLRDSGATAPPVRWHTPPPLLTAEEGTREADHLAAEMWRALPREGTWGQWMHREQWAPSGPQHMIFGADAGAPQAFHLVPSVAVEAHSYRDALALALAACGMLTLEEQEHAE